MSEVDAEMVKRVGIAVQKAGGRAAVLSKTSIPSSSLDRYLRGDTEMSASRLAELSAAAGVTIDWIVFGGPTDPFSGVALSHAEHRESDLGRGSARDGGGTVYIPLSNAIASAGAGIANDEDEETQRLPFSLSMLRRLGVSFESARFITARGDSMEPTIQNGGIVLIDISRRELQSAGIYVVTVDDVLLIKRVDPGLMGLRLISDNKAYADEVISRADAGRVNVVGKVFWVGGPL